MGRKEEEEKKDSIPLFDLEKQFIFYGSYHNNPVNIGIHLLCIWNIAWSAIYLLQLTPASSAAFFGLKINAAFVITFAYCIIYILTDLVTGTIGSLMFLWIYIKTAELVGTSATIFGFPGFNVALTVQITAWLLQFVGHGVFERRAPALLDNLLQAFVTAPLFVLLEVLMFFGYKKEFKEKCSIQIEKNIQQFKDSRKKKKKKQ